MRRLTLRRPSKAGRAAAYVVALVGFPIWIWSGPERAKSITDMPWLIIVLVVAAYVAASQAEKFVIRRRG